MYARVLTRLCAAIVSVGLLYVPVSAAAQWRDRDDHHQHEPAPQGAAGSPAQSEMPEQNMPGMQHMAHGESTTPAAREGSGTSWLPDETPMYAVHGQVGSWSLMAHGNAFAQYLRETGERGSHQTGSINWVMGMANRSVAGGHLQLRGMASLEPWTIGGCGYPDLLASGEFCQGQAIHDRQHPHDLFMELAAEYDHALSSGVRFQLYGGPVGEPALGPVAFPHRISAMPNPIAPITHHWFDATHITYGVITGGVYGDRWKAETSVFNGREPDEKRTNFDFAPLDSWSGRLSFLPTRQWAFQVSAGHLTEAETGHDGEPRIDVDRVTASATYHRRVRNGSVWANTIGWGRNAEPDADATNALLMETSVTVDDRDAVFARFELAHKSGHDLAIETAKLFTVAKLQGGYTRYLSGWKGLKPGVGASMSTGIVPESLRPVYGGRFNVGFGVFLTLRPGEGRM
jgi:hypothetical protein